MGGSKGEEQLIASRIMYKFKINTESASINRVILLTWTLRQQGTSTRGPNSVSHKSKSLTTLVLTHRFEKAGSAAAKHWQSQVIDVSQKCFRYIETTSISSNRT